MALLPRLVRLLAILIVLVLVGAPSRELPCPATDGAGHHHHHGHHPADCTACCCDCLDSAALVLPEGSVGPVQISAAAYRRFDLTLPGRAPQPEPDPPRPAAFI